MSNTICSVSAVSEVDYLTISSENSIRIFLDALQFAVWCFQFSVTIVSWEVFAPWVAKRVQLGGQRQECRKNREVSFRCI